MLCCRYIRGSVVDHDDSDAKHSVSFRLPTLNPSPLDPRGPVVCSATTSTSVVVANWKCLRSRESVEKLLEIFNRHTFVHPVLCVIVPPPLFLPMVQEKLINPKCVVAAPNVASSLHTFTDEISFPMLTEFRIKWILLGHAERRIHFHETNEIVTQKVVDALKLGFVVIVCVGETQQERETGRTTESITAQLYLIMRNIELAASSSSSWVTPERNGGEKNINEILFSLWNCVMFAYTPLWAFGTDHAATPQQAQEVHQLIRECLSQALPPELVSSIRILYGGSVNVANASELYGQDDVNGFLVGRESLTEEILTIVETTKKRKVKVHVSSYSRSNHSSFAEVPEVEVEQE